MLEIEGWLGVAIGVSVRTIIFFRGPVLILHVNRAGDCRCSRYIYSFLNKQDCNVIVIDRAARILAVRLAIDFCNGLRRTQKGK